jgi:hypothetical protein
MCSGAPSVRRGTSSSTCATATGVHRKRPSAPETRPDLGLPVPGSRFALDGTVIKGPAVAPVEPQTP